MSNVELARELSKIRARVRLDSGSSNIVSQYSVKRKGRENGDDGTKDDEPAQTPRKKIKTIIESTGRFGSILTITRLTGYNS